MTSDVDWEELVRVTRHLSGGFPSLHADVEALIQGDGGPQVYTAMTLLARTLIADVCEANTSYFDNFFGAVEGTLQVSAFDVRNLVITGLLEDLQNLAAQDGIARTEWERWLGPSTLIGWKAVADVWAGRITADEYNSVLRGN